MKILIVNHQDIETGKLKLFFSKYGTCEIASSGKAALEMFARAYQQKARYSFLNISMELPDVKGKQVVEAIRKWENDNKIQPQVKIMMELSEKDLAAFGAALEAKGVRCLTKPYNRKSLEAVLAAFKISKQAAPSAQPSKPAAAPPRPKVKTEEEKREEELLEKISRKINALVVNEEKFQGIEARQMLESLVKQGGKQAELLVSQHMTSPNLALSVRMELVRSAGYIKSPLFLVPLNRVVEAEENIRMVESALISISRYNDQRALNLLNNALKKLKNPMLLNTLRRQIAKIKEDKPILAILPRFLQSHKNPRNLRVSLDILKKIVTPEDTKLFLNYLKSGNEVIEDATFELLCYTADASHQTQLFNFFEDRIQRFPCLKEKECYDVYVMVMHVAAYYSRFPQLVDQRIADLKEFYEIIPDIRARQLIVSILCRSQLSDALNFIKKVYNEEEDLKETIIEKLSGNQQAVDFLFEKYHAGQELKETVIRSLLKSDEGLQYFIKHFFSFDIDKQEMVIRNLVFSPHPFLIDFMKKIFDTQLYSLKLYLMGVLRENYLFPFKDILFHPDNEREFMFMGKDFFKTIVRLFPITSVKTFFKKIAFDDISATKIKKFLEFIQGICVVEPVLDFTDAKLVNGLFLKIFKINNAELNAAFFATFENVKALDLRSYKFLLDAASKFSHERGAMITENEKGAINKMKNRFREQFPDIRDVENLPKELQQIFLNKPINVVSLEKLIRTNHMAVSLSIERFCRYLAGRFKTAEYIPNDERQVFFMKFPLIAKYVEYLWSKGVTDAEEWSKIQVTGELFKEFPMVQRIVISFTSKKLTALFRDQLIEVFRYIPITLDADKLRENDILLCDVDRLKEYMKNYSMTGRRILLYLEHRGDYAAFRDFNPKAFMDPVSTHRVIRMILKMLYLVK